jgi:hypothetical protein
MTTRPDPFKAEFGDLHGPTHWPSLLPDEARQAWVDLRGWVEALVDRFGLETRVVPPCWYRHNPLVEGLSALRDHERISFAPNASPTAAVDWFRALREIEHRLSEVCARTQCSVNEHRTDPPRSWLTDRDQWQAYVEADVHDREQQAIGESLIGGAWHSPGMPPGPSP